MKKDEIIIRGAKEHNLKNISVRIPRNKLCVITGVSGSGKSSLAFDTIFAEGQRRYVESLSAYARQFLGRMEKPDVEYIEGLSPSISIDQKGVSKNPRSTVGTVTEIYDYLRLLFARIGVVHCYRCGNVVEKQTVQQIVDSISSLEETSRIQILSPIITHMKGEHLQIIESIKKQGFVRARIDGEIIDLSSNIKLEKNKWHNIEIVVDRLIIKKNMDSSRLTESVEAALKVSQGTIIIEQKFDSESKDIIYSEKFACLECDISIAELEPRNFSFNTPFGACSLCTGLGYKLEINPYLIIPNPDSNIIDGGIIPWSNPNSFEMSSLKSLSEFYDFSLESPINTLPKEILEIILFGSKNQTIPFSHLTSSGKIYNWSSKFEGIVINLERRYINSESEKTKENILRFMTQQPCNECNGERLKPEALAVKVTNLNITDLTKLSVEDSLEWVVSCKSGLKNLSDRDLKIGEQIFKEIESRLNFLSKVGLNYLSLDRTASTLSGGEGQRIRLATQIGSGLMGVLYVCDEPSIGLHPIDNEKLVLTLLNLRDVGNSVIVVEHDESIMNAADHIIDLGPRAGENGGNIVAEGNISKIKKSRQSLTGLYLSKKKIIDFPKIRRDGNGKEISIINARENNLKNLSINIPLGKLVCITGVSGSGKSTLVNEILYKKLAQKFYKSKDAPGKHEKILGIDNIDKVINIDQSPIGRTPRSNPATYTGLFGYIRDVFASMPESKTRGYKAGRFSFNVKGGRCESCSGAGFTQIEMQFLPDVTVPCEVCLGMRYNREAIEIKFKNLSISDVLNKTVSEAAKIFENQPAILRKLQTLIDVGLDYIKLGQPATTLSGGEAQRIKLATELSKRSTGKTLYILDEPTTGLSFDDVSKLLLVLHKLVDKGNSIILIEHHLDLIKNADWIIDLGPEAGEKGGNLVGEGTPEFMSTLKSSATGIYLKKLNEITPNKKSKGNTKPLSKSTNNEINLSGNFSFPTRPQKLEIKKKNKNRFRRRRRR
tara:strand:+ start:9966 stop:12968 length:3003 start_codon:yes stop_codon:yes gene_type:complete